MFCRPCCEAKDIAIKKICYTSQLYKKIANWQNFLYLDSWNITVHACNLFSDTIVQIQLMFANLCKDD